MNKENSKTSAFVEKSKSSWSKFRKTKTHWWMKFTLITFFVSYIIVFFFFGLGFFLGKQHTLLLNGLIFQNYFWVSLYITPLAITIAVIVLRYFLKRKIRKIHAFNKIKQSDTAEKVQFREEDAN